jgi:hypothetical protein
MENSYGLCYHKCPFGSHGNGPFCAGECVGAFSTPCMGGCAKSAETCKEITQKQFSSVQNFAVNLAILAAAAVGGIKTKALSAAALSSNVLEGAVEIVQERLLSSGAMKIKSTAMDFSEQLVAAASKGKPIDWNKLDPLMIAAVVEAFNKPKCA